jgi:hypothetical protein
MLLSQKVYWLEKKVEDLEQALDNALKRIVVLEERVGVEPEPIDAEPSPEESYYEQVIQEIRARKAEFRERYRKNEQKEDNRRIRSRRNDNRG